MAKKPSSWRRKTSMEIHSTFGFAPKAEDFLLIPNHKLVRHYSLGLKILLNHSSGLVEAKSDIQACYNVVLIRERWFAVFSIRSNCFSGRLSAARKVR